MTSVKCHIKAATYWKSDISDYKYPINREYDKALFFQNGLNEVFASSECEQYFVLTNGVSTDVVKLKLSIIRNALESAKGAEKTEEQR